MVTETKKQEDYILIKHQINYTIQQTPNLPLKQINITEKPKLKQSKTCQSS
jgi:hypothetical protein